MMTGNADNNMEQEVLEEEFPAKNKSAAKRRRNDIVKALRKKNISEHNYGFGWYDNLHHYSKNKIHCSCGMCRFHNAYESNVQTHSDMMKNLSQTQQLDEYRLTESAT